MRTKEFLFQLLPFLTVFRYICLILSGCFLVLVSKSNVYVFYFLASAVVFISITVLSNYIETSLISYVYYRYRQLLSPHFSTMVGSSLVMSWFTPNSYTVVTIHFGGAISCSYRHYSFYYMQRPHEDSFRTTSFTKALKWMDTLKSRNGINQFANV